MKIFIVGAGVAGSYLGRLLSSTDYEYLIYEKRKNPDCRCAWGWSRFSEVKRLLRKVGFSADDYVLSRPKTLIANGVEFKVRDVVTFDKPRFISDMRSGLNIKYVDIDLDLIPQQESLIVDASGNKRAVMRNFDDISKPMIMRTIQSKVKTDLNEDCIYIFAKRFGYAWAFPLGDSLWHIGAGSIRDGGEITLVDGLKKKYGIEFDEPICTCSKSILWQPDVLKALYSKLRRCGYVAIGEAGGFVTAVGEGNTLAMETAECLYEAIKLSYDQTGRKDSILNILDNYLDLVSKRTYWIYPQHDFFRTLNKSRIKALLKFRKILSAPNTRDLEASIGKSILFLLSVLR